MMVLSKTSIWRACLIAMLLESCKIAMENDQFTDDLPITHGDCQYVYIYIYVHVFIYIYIHTYIHVHVYIYIYMHIYIYILYFYIYIYIHGHTHTYIYIYTYIHCSNLPGGKKKFRAKGAAVLIHKSLLPSMNHPDNQPWFSR